MSSLKILRTNYEQLSVEYDKLSLAPRAFVFKRALYAARLALAHRVYRALGPTQDPVV